MAHDPHSNRLIRNSVLNFVNSSLGILLGTVASILTARLLGPEKYGIYNVILWFMSVVSVLVGMGLIFAITKFVAEQKGADDHARMGQIVRYILWIELTISIITSFILLVRRTWIADYFFTPEYTVPFLISFAGLIPGILTAAYSSVLDGIQRFRYFLYYSLVASPVSLATKIIVLLAGGKINELLWVHLIFSIINTLFYRWTLHREHIPAGLFGPPPPQGLRKKILRYNFSISAIMLFDKVVWDKSEMFFLGKFCPAVQAGFYNMAFGLANKLTGIVSATFWKVLFPFMSERKGAEDLPRIRRLYYLSTRYIAFFAFPIAVGGMVLAFPLLKYICGHSYIPAQRVLQIIFFCCIFGQLSTAEASVLYAVDKQNFIMKFGGLLAIFDLGLGYLFIPKYGAVGAAMVNGIIQIFGFAGGIIYAIRVAHIQLPLKSLSKIFYSAVLMAVSMQVVLKVNKELIGFILSIPVGITIYLGNSMFIGTFEKEDAIILKKITSVLPARLQNIFAFVSNRIESSPNLKEGPLP